MPRQSRPIASSGNAPRALKLAEDTVPELARFYSIPEHFSVLRIVNGSAPPISLRALAWFVSNGVEDAALREDYEQQLREYTRRRFDPFRRCDRLEVRCGCEMVISTVGQMNFFRWMIERGLWKFVMDNSARVSADVARRALAQPRSSPMLKGGRAGDAKDLEVPVGFMRVCGRHVVVFD